MQPKPDIRKLGRVPACTKDELDHQPNDGPYGSKDSRDHTPILQPNGSGGWTKGQS